MPQYPLTTSPWIPVTNTSTGHFLHVGITEALTRAHELSLASYGHEHAALLRLLLAVYDSAAGPADLDEWAAAWRAPTLDTSAIGRYLHEWEERLDLLHPHRPAFQAGWAQEYPREHQVLQHAYLGGRSGAHFNRALLSPAAEPLPTDAAARLLLVRLGYDVGGIKGAPGGGRSYGAWLGHLAVTPHVSVEGRSLKEEILLNLPPQSAAPGDRPVWESKEDLPREPGTMTPVAGRRQWWTWPSRSLRLKPDDQGRICALAWHDGMRAEGGTLAASRAHDPMSAWRPGEKASPLQLADDYHRVPVWAGARTLLADCGVVAHAVRAAELGLLPADRPLRIRMSRTAINTHKTVIEHEIAGNSPLATPGVLARASSRTWLAAAAHAATAVPAAIRRVTRADAERNRPAMIVGDIVLDPLEHPWQELLTSLAAAPEQAEDAVRAWRRHLADAATNAFGRAVHGRTQMAKIEAEIALGRYLDAIALDALPSQNDAPAPAAAETAVPHQHTEPPRPEPEPEPGPEIPAPTAEPATAPTDTGSGATGTSTTPPAAVPAQAPAPETDPEPVAATDTADACAADAAACGTPWGYRQGGRCRRCRTAHNEESNAWRRVRNRPSEETIDLLVDLLRAGMDLTDAARRAGLHPSRARSLAATDPRVAQAAAGPAAAPASWTVPDGLLDELLDLELADLPPLSAHQWQALRHATRHLALDMAFLHRPAHLMALAVEQETGSTALDGTDLPALAAAVRSLNRLQALAVLRHARHHTHPAPAVPAADHREPATSTAHR